MRWKNHCARWIRHQHPPGPPALTNKGVDFESEVVIISDPKQLLHVFLRFIVEIF